MWPAHISLCCYFDRMTHSLTQGASHFGLKPATATSPAPENLVLRCYGVEVRVLDTAGLWLCHRLRQTLPPEFAAAAGSSPVVIDYVVTAVAAAGSAERREYLITRDAVGVFATAVPDDVYWWIRRDIDSTIAQRCQHLAFVRAGVVAWRGVAIVIAGRQPVGDSTIVTALVRRGAEYYSNTHAVLDDAGLVHPYRSLIEQDPSSPKSLRWIREGGVPEAIPVGLIVTGRFTSWDGRRPTVVSGPLAALPLLDSSVPGREAAADVQRMAARVAIGAVGLRGPWPGVDGAATSLLDIVEDAQASLTQTGTERSVMAMGGALAHAAESRLRTPTVRPASAWRDLVAARYVQRSEILTSAEHQRLLEYVRDDGYDGWHARVCRAHGSDSWVETSDRARTLPDTQRDDIWHMFERRLRALLPFVRRQLHVLLFRLGRIEWRVTRSGANRTFGPDIPAGQETASGHWISGVYFLRAGSCTGGGELRLYDSWQTKDSTADAETYSSLPPADNSIVFWPRGAPHEFVPPPRQQRDTDFAITFTFWEDTATVPVGDATVSAGGRVEAQSRDGAGVAMAAAMERTPAPALAIERRAKGGAPGRPLVAVVVPAYRPVSSDDRIALRHLRAHLGEFDRYVVGDHVPADGFTDFARAPACAFTDRRAYNRMLTSEHFYQAFQRYEYILIYQLDCLVFSNQLEAWCRKGFDYVGAPWFERWHRAQVTPAAPSDDIIDGLGTVGNGGFSLRNVDAALAVLAAARSPLYDRHVQKALARDLNEDIFWSFMAPQLLDGFRIPSGREALQFSFETEPRYCYQQNDHQLPFGCHGCRPTIARSGSRS